MEGCGDEGVAWGGGELTRKKECKETSRNRLCPSLQQQLDCRERTNYSLKGFKTHSTGAGASKPGTVSRANSSGMGREWVHVGMYFQWLTEGMQQQMPSDHPCFHC